MNNKKIAFIGGGNMGKSLIGGILKAGFAKENITVATPIAEEVATLQQNLGINGTTSNTEAASTADIIVLAVKPQVMQVALTAMTEKVTDFSNKLIISVMAGVTVERIASILPKANRIIRAMPNTPALIGYGMAGLFASATATAEDKEFAQTMFGSCGKYQWVSEEHGLSDITGLSGSGPAYFFLFMECMVNKAKELGYSEEFARDLITQLALGSVQMVIHNQDKTIAQLREAVTSKGGTTYEALQVFKQRDLNGITSDAIDACIKRADEMAKQF